MTTVPMVIARKPPGMAEAIWRRALLSFLRTRESSFIQVAKVNTLPSCHSCARGNPVLLRITLPCRLRLLMQTNLFNYPVMQTVVFTLIPWILDQVEDDKCDGGAIIPFPMSFPPPRGNPALFRWPKSTLYPHVIPASARESRVIGDYHKGLSSEDYFLQLTLISIVSSSV